MKDLKEFGGENTPFVILGNLINLSKKKAAVIEEDDAREFAVSEGGKYFEASPKDIDNINNVFLELSRCIINKTN